MSLFLPFNHRPSNVISGTSNYTCPAGKYARISGSLSTEAVASMTVVNGSNYFNSNNTTNSVTFEFWINTGDSVTVSTSNISASTALSSGTVSYAQVNDTGYARILVNASIVKEIKSACEAETASNTTGGGTIDVNGTSSAYFMVEEYDIV